MVTITKDLTKRIRAAGYTYETLAPLVGLTGSMFTIRKRGRVHWELDICYKILDILEIPRSQIEDFFIGGILPEGQRWSKNEKIR